MSIEKLSIVDYEQNLQTSQKNKEMYGEIFTPFSLINRMLGMVPESVFTNENAKWLDIGAGTGFFSMFLYNKLDNGLSNKFTQKETRHNHIIKNMLYMVEIQGSNVGYLREMFGNDANIIQGEIPLVEISHLFDYVIGNPPYNTNGIKKVPTNTSKNKKKDGKTVWNLFIKYAISHLVPNGKLIMITPSMWMKKDKAGMYECMMQYKLEKIACLSNTKTNQVFSGEAQTPTCYFVLSNEVTDNTVQLYDYERKEYIPYSIQESKPIPVYASSVISKLIPYVKSYGPIGVKKTNDPRKNSSFLPNKTQEYPHLNIRTAVLFGLHPHLVTHYSNVIQSFSGVKKLVLPHKTFGFPFVDFEGVYGISNRDNFVIVDRTDEELEVFKRFFSTKTALYLFEATRYRMKYLEKYVFELIPDITKIKGFPIEINDESIATFFEFDEIDIRNIKEFHKKEYSFEYV